MPKSSREAWNDVGDRFSDWGRRLQDRYKEAGDTAGDAATESQRKLEEAAREIGAQLTRAFTALGDTIRDEEAKSALKDAVGSLGEAVTATVGEAGDALRRIGSSAPPSDPPERPDDPTT
ncbi:MAG TPA: hypothetical protein VK646_11805 [Actinomycetota bacterium]|nr:hypothetical protein [Actinomycetota bacterium]